MSQTPLLLAAIVPLLAGCALAGGEGRETLRVVNEDGRAVDVVLTITQDEVGVMVFGEEIVLAPGESREYEVPMRPGPLTVAVSTYTGISERLRIDVPKTGDSAFELLLRPGSARLVHK